MKKTFLFFAALFTATVMNLQAADPVSYLYPEYNTSGLPTSGIKEWKTGSCTNYTVVADASSTVTWNAGWYVVNGADVKLTAGAVCNGEVHLILVDGAKLTANGTKLECAGIQISNSDYSLTIYGQANQTGQLIATGADAVAGIGSSQYDSEAYNITINGGVVTATGGQFAAGIGGSVGGNDITINGGTVNATGGVNGAGIGGGTYANGSFITINGGTVTATGGDDASGIGGGKEGKGEDIYINGGTVTANGSNGASGIGSGSNGEDASDILVHPSLILKADGNNPPTTVIAPTRTATTDIAGDLADKQYVTVETPAGPDMHDFLYFVGLNGNDTVRLNKMASNEKILADLTATFEYSKDRINWTAYDTWGSYGTPVAKTALGDAIALYQGDTVFFRAKGTNGKNTSLNASVAIYTFAFGADDQIAAGGNIMSLYDATCEQTTMTECGFVRLFNGAKQLVSAPKLPATTLAKQCYSYMFASCTSLIQAPELKATTLAASCYSFMFNNCSSLQVDTCLNDAQCEGALLVAPATVVASWNYHMFSGCKGTVTEPQPGGHYCIKEYVPVITGVTLTGYNAAYDGENHSVQVSGTIAGDVIEFSGDSATWSATNPSFKSVVDTLIYVRVQRASYIDWGGKATIKITPKKGFATGTSALSKTYDGNKTADVIVSEDLGDVVDGDEVIVSATGEFEDKNVGDDKDVTVTYTLSGKDAANYILDTYTKTVQASIETKEISVVNTEVEDKTYDGNTEATVIPGDLEYVVEGDDITISSVTGEFDDANVGEDISVSIHYELSGNDAGNYFLENTVESLEANITARAITMTSASDSKQFDGDPLTNATITFSGDGFVGSDTVSCTVTGSQTAVGSSPNYFSYTFSGSSEDNYAFTKVEGTLEVTAAPVAETYGRKVTNGNYGTICLAKKFNATEGVAALYVPATKDATMLYCEEVAIKDVVAGGAYIFKANADSVTFTLEGEAVVYPVNNDHMIGWLEADKTLAEESDYYGLNGNTLIKLAAGSTIKQNRAVIDLDNVSTGTPAPGRKYVSFGINTPTGLMQNAECTMQSGKMIINGQLIIIRDGKKFNAMGQEL